MFLNKDNYSFGTSPTSKSPSKCNVNVPAKIQEVYFNMQDAQPF